MAWSDDPTDAQLNAIFMMIRWYVPTTTAQKSILWLAEHATRHDVSAELGRLRNLNLEHKLSALNCFEGEIWEGFEYERT